ncbi:MAG TPA: phosphate ABC transporter substrate-binding protein PstS, partial [Vicinamibacterales bacterium]
MKKRGLALLLASLAALASVAAAGAKPESTTITGAGSTFVAPLVSQWVPALGTAFDYTVQYSAVGSGAGVSAITARTVDFGASDAPLTSDQFTACNGCVQIPWALAGTAIDYNLPGLVLPKNTNLKLTGAVIAKIYMGQITNWNDPAIAKDNPGAHLPDQKIIVVHRSDGSGTTFIFSDYLSK